MPKTFQLVVHKGHAPARCHGPSRETQSTVTTYPLCFLFLWKTVFLRLFETHVKISNASFSYVVNIEMPFLLFRSVRYGHWHKDKAQQTIKNVPRLIVFVVGGK